MAEASLRHQRERPGPPGRGINALNTLALAQSQLGRFEESSANFEKLFGILEEERRTRTGDAAVYRHNWALALQGAGQTRRALDEAERVVALSRELGGEEGVRPHALWTYGNLLSLSGRGAEAIAAVDLAVEKARSAKGLSLPFFALGFAAKVHAEAARPDDAERLLADLDRLLAATGDVQSRFRGLRDVFAGAVALERGDSPAALVAARRAIATFEREERPERDLLGALLLSARAANDTGEVAAASADAARALELAARRRGRFPSSRDVGAAELEAARAAWAAGEAAGARAAAKRALENLRAALGEEAPETRRARALLEKIG
jgi:tetratricopeptide (TPR) repeat protein